MKFKVGDKITPLANNPYRITTGAWRGVVVAINRGLQDDISVRSLLEIRRFDVKSKYFKLTMKIKKVNFLLKYELDEDPIEEYETLTQVKDRIKELVEVKTLKRESIVVYQIAKVMPVKVKTETVIEGI